MPRKTFTCEADVKAAVKELCYRHKAWFFMPSMNGYGRQGIPDFIICANGYFLAVETKFGKNKPTHHQRKEIAAIGRANGKAVVVNEKNLDALDALLRRTMCE